MGCNNSADETTDDDYDSVTGNSSKRRLATVDFSGQGLVILPVIPKPNVVKVLHLANNFLTRLPKDLSSWTSLEEVLLASNRFVRIPEGLATVKSLTALDVSNNPLSRTGGYDTLANLPKLKKLSLSMTALRQLPSYLGRCAKLKMLDIGYNQTLDLNSGDILSNLKDLDSLSVPYCSLRALPSSVQNCASLTYLNLTGNSGLDLSQSSSFGNHLVGKIEVLHLGCCGLRSLPVGVSSLHKLTELHVHQNQNLTSMEGMKSLSNLKVLDLADCGLKSLPKGLGDATMLERLDLGGNEPDSLSMLAENFPHLTTISVLGSKWAINSNGDDALWHALCQVKSLTAIEWQAWGEKGGRFTVSPYTTRFPLPLCSLKVKSMNGIPVREELFQHDNAAETLGTILNDGYYKVDFGYENNAFSTHFDTLDVIHSRSLEHPEIAKLMSSDTGLMQSSIIGSPLYNSVSGDETQVSSVRSSIHDNEEEVPRSTSTFADANNPNKKLPEVSPALSSVLSGVSSRYILYLYLQSSVYANMVLLPPTDVAALHYAHMIADAKNYAADVAQLLEGCAGCDLALLLNPKYRRAGLKAAEDAVPGTPPPPASGGGNGGDDASNQKNTNNSAQNENAEGWEAASRKVWGDFVRSREEALGRPLAAQLGYDVCPLGTNGSKDELGNDSLAGNPLAGCAAPPVAHSALASPLQDPHALLEGVVPSFKVNAFSTPLHILLKDFFELTSSFMKHRSRYEALNNECLLRYAKFLVVASAMKRDYLRKDNTSQPQGGRGGTAQLLPGKDADSTGSKGDAGSGGERPSLSNSLLGDRVMPVPTLGIQLALSLHKVTPSKFRQDLEILGLVPEDLTWTMNSIAAEKTAVEWSRLFDEPLFQDGGGNDADGGRRRGSMFLGEPTAIRKSVMFKEPENANSSKSLPGEGGEEGTTATGGEQSSASNEGKVAGPKTKRRVTITTIEVDYH